MNDVLHLTLMSVTITLSCEIQSLMTVLLYINLRHLTFHIAQNQFKIYYFIFCVFRYTTSAVLQNEYEMEGNQESIVILKLNVKKI